jgi:hypothetical protein
LMNEYIRGLYFIPEAVSLIRDIFITTRQLH